MDSTNHEILQQIRRDQEDRYVSRLARYGAQFPMQIPSELPLPPVPEDAAYETPGHIWDCANKSTAIYLATDVYPGPEAYGILPLSYEVWKRSKYPFLEKDSFLSKTIRYGRPFQSHKTSRLLDCDVVALPNVAQTHSELCRRFDTLHREICEAKANGTFNLMDYGNIQNYTRLGDTRLRPIFRALAVVIRHQDTLPENWMAMNSIEKGQATSVDIVLTGMTEGLLVPIDLAEVSNGFVIVQDGDAHYATTTLHNALHFISELQDRQQEAELSQGLKAPGIELSYEHVESMEGLYLHEYGKYSGPKITPELLLEHRDKSFIPHYFRGYMLAKTENKTASD